MTRRIDGRQFENPFQEILNVVDRHKIQGAGVVGNYDNVTFSISGLSRYRAIPGWGAEPTVGLPGEIHEEEEKIVAFSAPKETLTVLLKELKENHPYETPVIDVVDLVRHVWDCLE